MSHFSVLVIGGNLEQQLQPFHEFECTGINDEYVQDIDITAEARAQFEQDTETRLRGPDGTLHSFFDDKGNWRPEFSREEAAGEGIFFAKRRTYFVPEGYEKVDVPSPEVMSFAEHAASYYGLAPLAHGEQPDTDGRHKYGYVQLDAAGEVVKVVRRTNPRKKWDWWQVGGHWAGFFKLKPGAAGERGENGVAGSCANKGPGYADDVRKGDVDFEAMCGEASRKAGERYDQVHRVIAGRDWTSWEQVRDVECKGDLDAARQAYHAQPVIADLNAADILGFMEDLERYRCTRKEFVARARAAACSTFAVVKDGQWYERGRMGWFGCASDEKDEDTWLREFAALLDGLPDDTRLTVVDCHI